mgnify:CR=1 FL=1|jgi:Protein of unknown function (DUF1217).
MMSTLTSYQIISRTYDKELARFRSEPMQKREIEYFLEKAGSITSAEAFVKDTRLMKFVLTAYGMEEVAFPGLIRKLLEEGTTDPKAMANRFVDPRYKELAKDLGLDKGKTGNLIFETFRQKVVEKYQTVAFEKHKGEENGAIRSILYFKRKAPNITSWYQVLGDPALSEVVKTALSIPAQTASMDVERQAAMLEKRFPVADLKDPNKVDQLLKQYAIMTDMQSGYSTMLVPDLSYVSWDSSAFVHEPVFFEIDPSILTAANAYRKYF